MTGVVATSRGEDTRGRIVDAALRLFETKGWAGTTMRAVAAEAGVSLGNAYYYFAGKEHLVQGFYDRIQVEHAAGAAVAMRGRTGLAERLVAAEDAFLEAAAPYAEFAGKIFAVAADPASPLSPFSAESTPARQASTAVFRDVVAGSDVKGDARLLAELPELLWLAHLGVTLHWVHDASDGKRRTRELVARAAPIVERLVRLSRLRPLRGPLHEVLDLAADLRR